MNSRALFLIEELVLAMARSMISLGSCRKIPLLTPISFLMAFIALRKVSLLAKAGKKWWLPGLWSAPFTTKIQDQGTIKLITQGPWYHTLCLPKLKLTTNSRLMYLGLANTPPLFQWARTEGISMRNTKIAALETLEECLAGAKRLQISYQGQEPMTFRLIKIFLQKENIAYQALRTVWLEALGLHTKERTCFWISKLRDQEIIGFQANLAIIARKRH